MGGFDFDKFDFRLREWPQISIVTPCLNGGRYLEETINSVLNQGYPRLEYIIIDGGSADDSVKIIKKYESQLAYWVSEKDGGLYDGIQKGFEKAGGEVMAWIGSDDMYHPKALFTVAELFSRYKEIKWLAGATTKFDEYGRTVHVSQSQKFVRWDFLMGDYKWLQQESCFWHRSLWEQAGSFLNRELRYAGDFDLWMRFFRYEKLHITNALIGGFRERSSDQLSLDGMESYLAEAEKIIQQEKLSKSELKILKKYKIVKRALGIINKAKIINTEKILNKFKENVFGTKRSISFDRIKQIYVYN
ncbi:MAG: glycosyltransferase [Spirochaetales bacterium]|jgi:glycosyltransferase involved in cell wall biosynthesis|nr:glycosyltransferase [Spirochaetales bacterium]